MLTHLSVQNYAIIEQLEIDFSAALNVITGETGAGKSILVGALGLILGERADSSVLLNREKKCIVEGVFRHASGERLKAFLAAEELDIQDDVVVRREIAPNGKSRAFINDTPVNLSQLTRLSSMLVDMHQQFDTLELGDTGFQREVVDALAGNAKKLHEYRMVYGTLVLSRQRHSELLRQKNQFNKEFDYQQFQFTELSEAAFKENELEEIEQELKVQQNAEGIKNALTEASHELLESDEAIIRRVKIFAGKLEGFAQIQPGLQPLVDRLNAVYIELKDIAAELEDMNDNVNADAATLEKLNDRLSEGYRLLKKHGLRTTSELLQLQKELEAKLESVLNIDDKIAEEEKAMAAMLAKAEEMAVQISKARHAVVGNLEKQVNQMLMKVGMPNARLRVSITPVAPDANGSDNIDFLFNANIPAGAKADGNNNFQPVRKVASGGELSRLMLCIKSLVARSMDLPSMIFDEIDTGISGEAARQVAAIMKDLAAARQIICITHQPQIAGKATSHFLVYKSVEGNAVKTAVRLLDKEERIVSIAKMLSGEKPTAAAMENAREMVMN